MTRAERRLRTMAPELLEALVEAHELLSMVWREMTLPAATRTVILRLESVLAKVGSVQP